MLMVGVVAADFGAAGRRKKRLCLTAEGFTEALQHRLAAVVGLGGFLGAVQPGEGCGKGRGFYLLL